jgi:HAD superfamily hydrolase (TIGR01549 family)
MPKFNVKAVLLDFGGTLVHSHEPTWQEYMRTLTLTIKNHGHPISLAQLSTGLDKLYIPNTQGKFKDCTQYWTTILKQQHIRPDATIIQELDNIRKQTVPQLYRPYAHAIQTMSKLQKRYRLALVSNCTMSTRDEINNLSLTKFFEHMSLSSEVGVRKPDKRIYLDTLKALKLEGHECIFIADEIGDLEGARALDMKTLLVRQGSNTYSGAKNPNFKPDAECRRISEITRFL